MTILSLNVTSFIIFMPLLKEPFYILSVLAFPLGWGIPVDRGL